jgi:hypothetical protein
VTHAHRFVDAGEPMSIKIIPARCACGKTRLELVHPMTGRRAGIALPLDVVRTAAVGKEVIAGAQQIFQVGSNVLDALRRLGLLR